MEPVMFVELVGQDGRVISRSEVAQDAFPLTVRLEGERIVTTQSTDVWRQSPTESGLVKLPLVLGPLRSFSGAVVLSIITICVFTISTYASSYTDRNLAEVFGIALITFFGLTVWAGFWAFGGRIAHNPANFRDQLVWTCLAMLSLMIMHAVFMWGEFLFPASAGAGMITASLLIALGVVILYGHITIASRMVARRRWVVVTSFVAIVGIILGIGAYAAADKFDTDLDYIAALRPLDARYVPGESAEDFGHSIEKLKEQVDKDTQKQ